MDTTKLFEVYLEKKNRTIRPALIELAEEYI